jgi:hypothetical protein
MTWHTFLVGYVAVGAALLAIPIAPLRKHRLRVFRVMLASFAISFFIDYPGEHRPLWRFHEPSVFTVLDVPIENMIFIAASVPYILTLYLGAQSLLQRRGARS